MADAEVAKPEVVKGKSGLDIEKAVKHLDDNAAADSSGRCARFVREALLAGSVVVDPHPVYAKDYGSYLVDKAFVEIDLKGYEPVKGDVAVIQPYEGGNAAGHITMYNGSQWVSDFVQRDMWSGPGYRTKKPAYKIYRP